MPSSYRQHGQDKTVHVGGVNWALDARYCCRNSVRLSHGTGDPRRNVQSVLCTTRLAGVPIVFEATFRSLEFSGSPRTREVIKGTSCQKRLFNH